MMANEQKPSGVRDKVVTLASLEMPMQESVPRESVGQESLRDTLTRERYLQAIERLRQATDANGSNVLITVQDREVSLLQSKMAEEAAKAAHGEPLDAGGLEVKFGTGFGGGDWFGWVRSLLDWVDRRQAHALVRPTTTNADTLPDQARIAMTADWGTGLYGAPKIAERMKQIGGFDMLLHLGDVYYSGTNEEVQERFIDVWPRTAGRISRTLNSNHEMYSGGFGYFDHALPALGQASSYFAFQNSNWLLVGLDTAYVDHDMDAEQVAWLNVVIRNAGNRKVVLFSHQQLFSRLDNQGPKLEQALRHLLESRRITAWYWGHEHQCVIYDAHPRFGLRGRCLGNGGIPEVRKREVRQAPAAKTIGGIFWKRMSQTDESPACLVLDGPNPDIVGEEEKFVPHSFVTLEFNGPTLTEKVLLPNGTEIYSGTV
jgi:calcineurin-like phosphoesterase family protein